MSQPVAGIPGEAAEEKTEICPNVSRIALRKASLGSLKTGWQTPLEDHSINNVASADLATDLSKHCASPFHRIAVSHASHPAIVNLRIHFRVVLLYELAAHTLCRHVELGAFGAASHIFK